MPAGEKALSVFLSIGEVAEQLDLPIHVLRFWEARFDELRPLRRGKAVRAKRFYRPDDVALINGIRFLLHARGFTIRGVQRVLREDGVEAVRSAVNGLKSE